MLIKLYIQKIHLLEDLSKSTKFKLVFNLFGELTQI